MVHPQKRIAIFMPSLFGGGGQRSMVNLANGMAESGYAVDLVLLWYNTENHAAINRTIALVLDSDLALHVDSLRPRSPAALCPGKGIE